MAGMLDGFTVGITADRRAEEQASLFERRGAVVIHGPTIHTLPLGDDDRLREATEAVVADPPDVLVANTGIGIRSWFGAAESWDLGEAMLDALATARIYARGPKAAGAVHSLGLAVLARPASERLRDCIELVLDGLRPGERVVVQRDGGPPPPEADKLRAAGADVLEIPVYRWESTGDPRRALRLAEAVVAGRVHAVTFTSSPAVTTWLALVAGAGLGSAVRSALVTHDVVVGCVGPVCAEVAMAEGLGDDIVQPRTSRLGPLVRAVGERLIDRSRRVGDLVVSGNVAHVDGRRIELSDTDARILALLAAKPGAVVAKSDLLRSVWGDPRADPHLVEVAVARLRRRLGPGGAAITAIPRRGYLLQPRA